MKEATWKETKCLMRTCSRSAGRFRCLVARLDRRAAVQRPQRPNTVERNWANRQHWGSKRPAQSDFDRLTIELDSDFAGWTM